MVPPSMLRVQVMAEQDAAGEQVGDLARVVRVGVQPFVHLGARVGARVVVGVERHVLVVLACQPASSANQVTWKYLVSL